MSMISDCARVSSSLFQIKSYKSLVYADAVRIENGARPKPPAHARTGLVRLCSLSVDSAILRFCDSAILRFFDSFDYKYVYFSLMHPLLDAMAGIGLMTRPDSVDAK